MNIEYAFEPSGNCPVQAEGTINGKPFYFRARGSHLCLYIAQGDEHPFNSSLYHCEEHGGKSAKYELEKFGKIEYSAGWATKDECKSFIEVAAKKLIEGDE